MKCKRKIMVGIAFVAVVLCILFQSNTFGRKKSELIIEEVDLKNNCIYATAKNQLYDTDDNYIIYGVSNYLKGNLQLSYLVIQITRPQRRGQRVHTHEYDVHGVVLLNFYLAYRPTPYHAEPVRNNSYPRSREHCRALPAGIA